MDGRRLRDALGTFPTGVSIITTVNKDGEPQGLTCNSFASLSLDPPLILWSLRSSSGSLDTFRQAAHFVVNILAEGQQALSNQFATAAAGDRFVGVPYESGTLGGPVLEGCVASLECKVHAEHEAGDHILFIGEVVQISHEHQKPSLAFYRGRYMAVAQSLLELAAREQHSPAGLAEARTFVTGALLQLACERASEDQIAEIEKACSAVSALPDPADAEARHAAGVTFFSAIAAASGNAFLSALGDALNEVVVASIDPNRVVRENVYQARRDICASIARHDSAGAAAAFAAYLSALADADGQQQ